MTDKDRELEKYLKGDSKLSHLYQEAGRETAPPELDDAILAAAKREVRAKPGLSKVLAPVALAASLILGVNLAWNVHEAKPVPESPRTAGPATAALEKADAPARPALAAPADVLAAKATAPPPAVLQERYARAQAQGAMQARAEAGASRKKEPMSFGAGEPSNMAAGPAAETRPAAVPAVAMADSTSGGAVSALSEAQKIDRLIAYVAHLQGTVFIRNGSEYGPDKAAEHLQLKREKAGDRVKTADDFIKLCASHSYVSGEAYLIRYPDGRTRTAEDVLREELARMEP